MPTRAGSHRRKIALGLLTVLGLGAGYLGCLRITGNFNTVVAGEFYRSGQPASAKIDDYVKAHGIRTIINLRGKNAGHPWYDAEVHEGNRLGIAHIDFAMSARRELSPTQAAALIALFKTVQKPILVHCEAGADRSGLASALYLAAIKRADPAAAEAQLSIRFGHLSLPFIPEYAMDRSWRSLAPALVLRTLE